MPCVFYHLRRSESSALRCAGVFICRNCSTSMQDSQGNHKMGSTINYDWAFFNQRLQVCKLESTRDDVFCHLRKILPYRSTFAFKSTSLKLANALLFTTCFALSVKTW